MATPNAVVGTYRRYKAGTTKLLKWLCESTHEQTLSSETSRTTKILTSDLIPLATSIVNAKDPRIEIPLEILGIAQDVIQGRERCAEWYRVVAKSEGNDSAETSNAGHEHFIAILRQVLDVLKVEFKKRRPKRKKAMPELPNTIDDLSNLYSLLELEETQGYDEAHPKSSKGAATKQPQNKPKEEKAPEFQVDDGKEEQSFAVYALLNDMHEIRKYIKYLWQRHVEGELSFLTAARITEKAFLICENIGMEFEKAHDKLNNVDKLLASVMYSTDGSENTDATKSDLLCLEAYSALHHFRDLQCYYWCKKKAPIFRVVKEHQIPFPVHGFSKALLAIFRDIQDLLPRYSVKGKVNDLKRVNMQMNIDTYTGQLLRITHTGMINVGVLCTTQMYIDIWNELNGDMARGFREVSKVAEGTSAIVESYKNFYEDADQYSKAHLPDIELQRRKVITISTDKYQLDKKGWEFESTLGGMEPIFVPLDLLAALPILPAVHAERQLLSLQYFGSSLYSLDQSLLSMAHLYRGAKERGTVTSPWEDMEFLITSQQYREQLVKQSDESIGSIARLYDMALGLSLSEVNLKGGREPKLPQPKKCSSNSRSIHPISDLYDGWVKVTKVDQSLGFFRCAGLHSFYAGVMEYLAHGGQIKGPDIAKQWETTRILTPVQLLDVSTDIMIGEEPHLHFDHIGFFMSYHGLLLDFLADYHYRFKDRFAKRNSIVYMYELVHCVLWEAATSDAKGLSPKPTALHHAGELIEQFVKSSGGEYATNSLKVCSGHIDPDEHSKATHPTDDERRLGQPDRSMCTLTTSLLHSILHLVHGIHAHEGLDHIMISRQIYNKSIKEGASPKDANESAMKYISENTDMKADSTLSVSTDNFSLTAKQIKATNDRLPYNNGGENSGDICPWNLELLLKDSVPYLSQHAHLYPSNDEEEYERRAAEVEKMERKRGVWSD